MAARPKSVVVGYDGTEPAHRALDAAADLIGYGSLLTVVTAAPAADLARERVHRRNVQARFIHTTGDPNDDLVAAATSLSADLVVVAQTATAGTGTDLVRLAPCDVLVVR